jgi:protease-4
MQDMDNVFYQQKIKRSNSFLKLLVFVLIVILIASSGLVDLKKFGGIKKDYIGYINIDSVISDESINLGVLENLREDKHLKGLIVKINSPGGAVVASQRTYKALKALKEEIPVVATMQDMAASGGYMAALGADKIYAHESTITASVGVKAESSEIVELADKLGIKFNVIKSGEHKASLNPIEKLGEEDRKIILEMVNSNFKYFLELVSQNRDISHEVINKISDGRIVNGIQAKEMNLVDEIGGFVEAKKWLTEEKQVDVSDKEPKPIDLSHKESYVQKLLRQSIRIISREVIDNLHKIKLDS